jgi:hypothetical protein
MSEKAKPLPEAAEVHAHGLQEHSLCGLAPEAFETGDHSCQVVFAQQREQVTCKHCRAAIDYIRANYRGYRYAPKEQA